MDCAAITPTATRPEQGGWWRGSCRSTWRTHLDAIRIVNTGAHLHFLNTGFLNGLSRLAGEINSPSEANTSSVAGCKHVLCRSTAFDAVTDALHDFVVLAKGRDGESAQRVAIVFCDDHILSHVDQTTRQVTCVGRLQGSICKTLSRTVR